MPKTRATNHSAVMNVIDGSPEETPGGGMLISTHPEDVTPVLGVQSTKKSVLSSGKIISESISETFMESWDALGTLSRANYGRRSSA